MSKLASPKPRGQPSIVKVIPTGESKLHEAIIWLLNRSNRKGNPN